MKHDKKRAIRVNLARVDEQLTQALGRELEGKQPGDARSATGWNDPYRASGTKHSTTLGEPINE
jgi:hypothetical protein